MTNKSSFIQDDSLENFYKAAFYYAISGKLTKASIMIKQLGFSSIDEYTQFYISKYGVT